MNTSDLANELYNKYGPVTRARNCFLYTKKGIRITDLYQENGRAILGWQGGAAFTHLKNFLCRGLTGSFICEDKSKVQTAISELLDGKTKGKPSTRQLFYFFSKKAAIKAAVQFSPESTTIYQPWNPSKSDYSSDTCVIISPALPWTDNLFILAVKTSLFEEKPESASVNPCSVKLPYSLQVGIARATYDLIQALKIRTEKDFFLYDTVTNKYWTRKGPYLFPKVPQEKYDDFIRHCLQCQLYISPDYNTPSIIPFGADKGVFSKLKNSPFEF